MKKLLIATLILVSGLFAQNTDQTTYLESTQKMQRWAFENTDQAFRMKLIDNISDTIAVIDTAQDVTASWVLLGDSLDVEGYNQVLLYTTIDINNTTDFRFRAIGKYTTNDEDYVMTIEAISRENITVNDGYIELDNDADQLVLLRVKTFGSPILKIEISAGTVGATAGSVSKIRAIKLKGEIADIGDGVIEIIAGLDSIEVNLEELNGLTQDIKTELLNVGVDTDSILANVKEGNLISEQIETELLNVGVDVDSTLANVKENNVITEQIETELLNVGVDVDSSLANIKESNGLLQQLDNNTDGLEANGDSLKADTELLRALIVNLRTLLTSLEGKDFSTQEGLDSLKNDTELLRSLFSTLNGLVSTKEAQDSLKNDTELIRSLISTLNGIVATQAGSDSLKNDTELVRGILADIRTITSTQTGLDSLKNDTEILRTLSVNLRTLLTSIDGKDFSTGAKQDSSKNDTELIRGILANIRTIVATQVGLDSLKSDTELLRTLLAEIRGNQTDGSNLTTPYLSHISVRDSVVGIDTATYSFSNNYLTGYISIYNSNVSTPDTLVFENYSIAAGGYVSSDIGLKEAMADTLEADNTSLILAASSTKTWRINQDRSGAIRVRPKTLTGRTSAKKVYLEFKGSN